MFLGVDIGTSAVKAVLTDDAGTITASASAPLTVSRPRALWSEQDPEDWWRALVEAVQGLPAPSRAAVRAMGLSGQMHGAVLLDATDRVLRPAILWNDGRAGAECAELERIEPRSRALTGNLAMPGFTAPKLLWVRRHEPEVFAATARVLLPKDYVRLRLTGEHVSDLSDSAGTLWLDVGARRWSEPMLAACGLTPAHMPRLVEGSEPGGALTPVAAAELGLPAGVIVAGGGGDNAAGAVGVGAIAPGQGLVSLGTSGVIFLAGDRFAPATDRAVHAFCHALPERWHQMAVILSAASALDWVSRLTGFSNVGAAVSAAEGHEGEAPVFLPYLSGERTPHNDPGASGVFFGLDHDTDRAALVRSVLEGVAFALAEGAGALRESGMPIESLIAIGGGARSRFWLRLIATALDMPLQVGEGSDAGAALGAARLARLALTGEAPEGVCVPPARLFTITPDPSIAEGLERRRSVYRRLYPDLRATFAETRT